MQQYSRKHLLVRTLYGLSNMMPTEGEFASNGHIERSTNSLSGKEGSNNLRMSIPTLRETLYTVLVCSYLFVNC